jgi:DNA-binding beta-propeller fold protein YncE
MKCFGLGRLASGACLLLLGGYPLASQQAVNYHLINTIHLPQAPGNTEYFDYITVDPDARRVYVSHGTEVDVLNADDYSLIGRIGGLQRCHGVIVIKELGKGYITDGEAKVVVVFDLDTLKVTGQVKADQPVDSLVYDPVSRYIFTINGGAKTSTVIDPAKEAVVKNIDLAVASEFPALDDKGTLYDNSNEKSEVTVIDTRSLAVKARWPTAPEGESVAMAIDTRNHRLFSAGRNPQFLVMINTDTGKVIQSFPITAGVDAAVFEPETGLLFASTREGMMHIFHEDTPDKLSEVQTVKTEYGAKTMALDPKTHKAFLSTSDFDPPAPPSEKQPNPLPQAKPGNFRVLVYGR